MSYIHHIFDFIILCTIFSTVHLYFQQNLQFSLGYFIYHTILFQKRAMRFLPHPLSFLTYLPLLWYFWILLFRWQIVDSSMHELVESITSRSFFIHSERESHVTSAASFNTTNSISVSFNVMMLLLLRFFSFFLGAIVLLPFR